MINSDPKKSFFPHIFTQEYAVKAGFRLGDKGTHSSRTMMLQELSVLFAATSSQSSRQDYTSAIVDENCLAKPTVSSRRLTNQRLGELYGLDPSIPLFRVFRKLWEIDEGDRRLHAILCAMARDPLLAATAPCVLSLPIGSEFRKETMRTALRQLVGERFNEGILEKVIRNIASSWTQSGHLEGRTFKIRRIVNATPASVAFAMYLAHAVGFRGAEIFVSGWMSLLDCSPTQARFLASEAKRIGLIDLRMAGDVVEINLSRLDPGQGGI
jgi:hypothetical protein